MNEGLDKQLAVDRAVKIFSDLDIDGDGDITEVRDVIFGLPGVYSLQFNREPLSNQNSDIIFIFSSFFLMSSFLLYLFLISFLFFLFFVPMYTMGLFWCKEVFYPRVISAQESYTVEV